RCFGYARTINNSRGRDNEPSNRGLMFESPTVLSKLTRIVPGLLAAALESRLARLKRPGRALNGSEEPIVVGLADRPQVDQDGAGVDAGHNRRVSRAQCSGPFGFADGLTGAGGGDSYRIRRKARVGRAAPSEQRLGRLERRVHAGLDLEAVGQAGGPCAQGGG